MKINGIDLSEIKSISSINNQHSVTVTVRLMNGSCEMIEISDAQLMELISKLDSPNSD